MPMARRSRSPHFKEPRAGINMFTAPKTARKQSHGYNSMGDLWTAGDYSLSGFGTKQVKL